MLARIGPPAARPWKLWENDSGKASAGMAINYRAGQLDVDDRHCTRSGWCRLFLVVLTLRTGCEYYYTATDTDEPRGYGRVTAGGSNRGRHSRSKDRTQNARVQRNRRVP